jgi:hypothetical protein
VTRTVHFQTGLSGQKRPRLGKAAELLTARVPRISRMMALAIHFEQLIREGKVKDYAELARLGHVTRARVTQVMDLLSLAPEVQESLLLREPNDGPGQLKERDLRRIAAHANWCTQRELWLESQ